MVQAASTGVATRHDSSASSGGSQVDDLSAFPRTTTRQLFWATPVAGSIGLGFAVPAATAERVAKSLINDGRVVHGDFGLSVVPVLGPNSQISPSGLYITEVAAGGPAAQAGLKRSDIITAIADQPVSSADKLQETSLTKPPGTRLPLSSGEAIRSIQRTLCSADLNI